MVGRPTLPQWMFMAPSRFRAIAFLYGTPITSNDSVEIQTFARNVDNYELVEQILEIKLTDDGLYVYLPIHLSSFLARFRGTTAQTAEILVKNYDTFDFFTDHRSNLIARFETVIHETFRGRHINAYIVDLRPAVNAADDDLQSAFRRDIKFG